MILKPLVTFFFLALIFSTTKAQIRSTKETRILLIVDQGTDGITGMELMSDQLPGDLHEKYPDAIFYMGLLRGDYKISGEKVEPRSGATITVYTNQQVFKKERVFSDKEYYSKGETIRLGNLEAEIISNRKGELVLKAE